MAASALAREKEREKAALLKANEHRKKAEELSKKAGDIEVVGAVPIGTSAEDLAKIVNELNKEGGK
jgi:hypothetical protein